jgi:hypothetical protein
MTVCIVAIFKNERHILREWMLHHINQGISHFFLIDNGSTDNGSEELIEFADVVTLVKDSTRYRQEVLYNYHFLEYISRYDWMMTIDLDEFVYARKHEKLIPDVLNKIDKSISEVQIRWKMFGSSGHIEQPDAVLPHFVHRCDLESQKHIIDNVKSIARTDRVRYIRTHEHDLTHGRRIVLPRIRNEKSLSKVTLHLNHYRIQSLKWFINIKCTRGDVAKRSLETRRLEQHYFTTHDFKDVIDNELACCMKSEIHT